MTGTRLPDERAQAVRSLGSLLNYVRLDPRKGYCDFGSQRLALEGGKVRITLTHSRKTLTLFHVFRHSKSSALIPLGHVRAGNHPATDSARALYRAS
uniref:Uncharacterized protein n=1 Tax=Brassica oleracea var. oleracea TaxID=109376 RepID=A0A0D3BV39_BRAOL